MGTKTMLAYSVALGALLAASTAHAQRILTVPSAAFPTLRQAILVAQPNDQINFSGTTGFSPLDINRPVTIVGSGGNMIALSSIAAPVTIRNCRIVPLHIDFCLPWHCSIWTSGTIRFEDCVIEGIVGYELDEFMPRRAIFSGSAGRAEFVRTQVRMMGSPPPLPHAYCGDRRFEWKAIGAVAFARTYFEDCVVQAGNPSGYFYDPSATGPECWLYGEQPGAPAVVSNETVAIRTRFEDSNSNNQPHPLAAAPGPLRPSQFGQMSAYDVVWQLGASGGANGTRGAVRRIQTGTAPLAVTGALEVNRRFSMSMTFQPGESGLFLLGEPVDPVMMTSAGELFMAPLASYLAQNGRPVTFTVPNVIALAGVRIIGQALVTQPTLQLQNPLDLRIYL